MKDFLRTNAVAIFLLIILVLLTFLGYSEFYYLRAGIGHMSIAVCYIGGAYLFVEKKYSLKLLTITAFAIMIIAYSALYLWGGDDARDVAAMTLAASKLGGGLAGLLVIGSSVGLGMIRALLLFALLIFAVPIAMIAFGTLRSTEKRERNLSRAVFAVSTLYILGMLGSLIVGIY